eukprot:TRINITY_DN4741_c0_g1_i1.p1 TRINITY_DN4741_c0_g1~~TRINITY_DN4741_c0_g1_i1.p1  ORF type:complete len:1062 (-),score=244.48 TRINITY_DN4741_c0_g1_i1:53-3190(-)
MLGYAVVVYEAADLAPADSNGLSDPYVIVYNGDTERQCQRFTTKVIDKTLSPKWDQKFKFAAVPGPNVVKFTLMDKDLISADDFLGDCELDIMDCYEKKITDIWLLVRNEPDKPKGCLTYKKEGKLHVKLVFKHELWAHEVLSLTILAVQNIHGQNGQSYLQLLNSKGKAVGPCVRSTKQKTSKSKIVWNQTFNFSVPAEAATLEITLKGRKKLAKITMGSVVININEIPIAQELAHLFSCSNCPGPEQTFMSIKFNFQSVRPQTLPVLAPLTAEDVEKMRVLKAQRASLADQRKRFGSCGSLHVQVITSKQCGFWPGVAILRVIEAKNLTAMDMNGLSDPYVVVSYGKQTHKTKIVTKTLDPVWNEDVVFKVEEGDQPITFAVWDWDRLSEDDRIGDTSLFLSEIEPMKGYDVWADLNQDPNEELVSCNPAKKAKDLGYKPHLPIVLVPGFASSGLRAVESTQSSWVGQRVWLSLEKIGTERMKTMGRNMSLSVLSRLKSRRSAKNSVELDAADGAEQNKDDAPESQEDAVFRNLWVSHVVLADDGCHDPPGIALRPIKGRTGVKYLDPSTATAAMSYVMGPLIDTLEDFGYTESNLVVASYDWRLPPCYVEERDHFHSKLQKKITKIVKETNEKVVIVGHSMGNRTIQYFLNKVKNQSDTGRQWIKDHIHTFLAVGPPFLGAPKALRGVITGDRLGLEGLLSWKGGMKFSWSLGSTPFLYPVGRKYYFHDPSMTFVWMEKPEGGFEPADVLAILNEAGGTNPIKFRQDYYVNDPNFGGGPDGDAAILEAPPVERLVAIYGVNLPTEKFYLYARAKDGSITFSKNTKCMETKFQSYKIKDGIAYETPNTPQPLIKELTGVDTTRCGDGTVPYESLAFCTTWRDRIPELVVQELPLAEHRAILKNKVFFHLFIDLVSMPPPGVDKMQLVSLSKYAREGGASDNEPRKVLLDKDGFLTSVIGEEVASSECRPVSSPSPGWVPASAPAGTPPITGIHEMEGFMSAKTSVSEDFHDRMAALKERARQRTEHRNGGISQCAAPNTTGDS